MKICVVTPYDADNYGAMNQTLALKEYLEKLGHQVFHLRIHTDEEQNSVIHEFSPQVPLPSRRMYIRIIKHPRSTFFNIIKSEKKRNWRKNKEAIIRTYLRNFKIVDDDFIPDLYIVGSDEVWNISNPLFQKKEFWEKRNAPCLVYAASMSKSNRDTFLNMPRYIESFKNYNLVSVRDRHTQDEFSFLTNQTAELVVDPTILNFDFRVFEQKKENIIVVYGYSHQWNAEAKSNILKFAKEKHLKIVSLGMYLDFADKNILCVPEKFAEAIASAKYVITTTFHGSIFSILTKSQFVTYNPLTKASDFLQSVGAENQIVLPRTVYSDFADKLVQQIDYDGIFKKLHVMQENSKSFIDNSIVNLMSTE